MGRVVIACAGLVAMLVVAGAGGAAGVSARPHRYPGGRCPAHVLDSHESMSRVSRKAEALIPSAFSSELNRAQRKGFVVTEVVWLALGDPTNSRAATLRRAAARSCGKTTAEASWAVGIRFPNIPLPTANQQAFVVRTASGWRLYRPLAG